MLLQKFFDPIVWLEACQCLCTRRKFAHKQFPFPLIQSITQSTQFHPSLNTKIYTFDLLPFNSRLQIYTYFTLNIRVRLFRRFRLSMQLCGQTQSLVNVQFYLNLSACTFSKLCAALALCLQTKWLRNPQILKLPHLLNMLENYFSISISEVSCPKNSTDDVSRFSIRILLIVIRFEAIQAIIYPSDQQMSLGRCNFSSVLKEVN